MKVFLFLCLWTIPPLFLHAQTTLQGTFIPVQELTSLEYRIQEERADMRYKISLSTSGVQAESYGSYQGERWGGLSWKPEISWEGLGTAVLCKFKDCVFHIYTTVR